MEGVIKFRNEEKQYLMITYGPDTYAHFSNLVCPNGHNCLFQAGVSVNFEERVRYDGRLMAVNVVLNDPFELDEWEESILMQWYGTYGFASRLCGCEIFVAGSNLSDAFRQIGTHFIHKVAPTKKGFHAVEIQVVEDNSGIEG